MQRQEECEANLSKVRAALSQKQNSNKRTWAGGVGEMYRSNDRAFA
jgi:hypothetical protein